jgi:membrane-associated phospholipid phosphatase
MQIANRTVRCCLVLSCSWLLTSTMPVAAQDLAPLTQQHAAEQADPSPAPAQAGGVGFLVRDTVRGFEHLASGDSLKWLTIGAVAAMAVRPMDRPVSNGMLGRNGLDEALDPGQTIGGARLQLAGALATFGVGKLTGSTRTTAVGADLLKAQIISQALTAGIKMSVRRTRPDGTQFSFPSGHTSVTFASATVLQRHFGWHVGIPAYAVASYVAASRVQEQRHFLSDVAFGAAIGIVAGRAVTIGRGDHRLAVSPMATPGGGGVTFTWLERH